MDGVGNVHALADTGGSLMAETILGVPMQAAPKEPTRVLDTVVDLTNKPQVSPPRRRHRRSGEDVVQTDAIEADSTTATPPPPSGRKRRAAGSGRARSITAVAGASAPPSAGGRGHAKDRDGIELITADLVGAAEALAQAARAHAVEIADLRTTLQAIPGALR
jgi:hypothetical protein